MMEVQVDPESKDTLLFICTGVLRDEDALAVRPVAGELLSRQGYYLLVDGTKLTHSAMSLFEIQNSAAAIKHPNCKGLIVVGPYLAPWANVVAAEAKSLNKILKSVTTVKEGRQAIQQHQEKEQGRGKKLASREESVPGLAGLPIDTVSHPRMRPMPTKTPAKKPEKPQEVNTAPSEDSEE
jgi:hypothetical protein